MLTKKDFVHIMEVIKKDFEEVDKFIKDIGKYFDDTYIFELGNNLIDSHINTLVIAMQDTIDDSWISWYIWENDWGKKKMEAGYYDSVKPICNLSDLYDLIIKGQEYKKGA